MGDEGASVFQVLAIDDHKELLTSLARLLRARGFQVTGHSDPREGIAALQEDPRAFDIVISDVQMPGMNGIEVLQRVKTVDPDIPVIMLTADATAGTAVAALKSGAFDYLTKPFDDAEELALKLTRAGAHGRLCRRARKLEERLQIAERFETLVGTTRQMRDLFATIDKVARSDVSVLILGESGTGKELVARAIHSRSGRAKAPFVAFNCGAVPESLVDSELFGHVRGAFTGATDSREGVFVEAHRGTLFLDEVGNIPAAAQMRLLRVLQEGEIRPVGGSGARKVDVRVLAATNADLEAAVKNGAFREDLYYRLNVVTVRIPPLRDRIADVPLLAAHFLDKHATRVGRQVPTIHPQALEALTSYSWPGNVRELENAIQRCLAMTQRDVVELDALPPAVRDALWGRRDDDSEDDAAPAGAGSDAGLSREESLFDIAYADARKRAQQAFERRYVTRLLEATGGNISEAARKAGLDRANFRRILSRNEIDAGAFRDDG